MRRREFLKGGSAIVAAGALPALLLVGAPSAAVARRFRRAPQIHRLSEYRECIGTWFYIRDESWRPLELIEVSEHASSELVEQFSCHFSGTSNPPIRSGTYAVRSRLLGRFQLYLAATGDDAYESFARADFALLR
jgi:hypothetical protein